MKLLLMSLLSLIVSATVQAQGLGMGRDGMGRNNLMMCQGCHDMGMRGGGMGMGMGMMRGETAPILGGQHAEYLEKALKAYRSGDRSHWMMNRMASMLSDQDIREIARFYAARETDGASAAEQAPLVRNAPSVSCAACHVDRTGRALPSSFRGSQGSAKLTSPPRYGPTVTADDLTG